MGNQFGRKLKHYQSCSCNLKPTKDSFSTNEQKLDEIKVEENRVGISEEVDLSIDGEINEEVAAHRLKELLASEIESFKPSLNGEENVNNKQFFHQIDHRSNQKLNHKKNWRSQHLFRLKTCISGKYLRKCPKGTINCNCACETQRPDTKAANYKRRILAKF